MKMPNKLMPLAMAAFTLLGAAGCVGDNPHPKTTVVHGDGRIFAAPAPLPPTAEERHEAAFAAAKTLDGQLAAAKAAARDPHLAIAERMAWAEKAVRLALRHPTFDGGDAFANYAAFADAARAANIPLNPIFLNLAAAHHALTR